MAIEKMSLINLVGSQEDLEQTCMRCLKSGYFHPEMAINTTAPSHGFRIITGENPYTSQLNNLTKLAAELEIDLGEAEFNNSCTDLEEVREYIAALGEKLSALAEKKQEMKGTISNYEQTLIQIGHLAGLNVSFDDIFACKYVKVRFGRLPADSYSKLVYYDKKPFFFFSFDHDSEYHWGVFFAPANNIEEYDEIFSSLYFERMRVPDYAHGTPETAKQSITNLLSEERKALEAVQEEIQQIRRDNQKRVLECYHLLSTAQAAFDLKKHVATYNTRFLMVGFIPAARKNDFLNLFSDLASVGCTAKPHDADPAFQPPVKLKNNKFSRPFEMFVNMYSLPSHKDIDPTSLVAISYTLLFGIMFGDLGQGLLLSLFGVILTKWKKMALGPIMTRIGFSSAFFGLIYGSVFGYEHLLDPMYKALFGLEHKPVEVFDTGTTNLLLVSAIAIGAVLIMISICINIYLGFRSKDYERAVFGHNGIAGLVLYASAVGMVVDMMVLHIGYANAAYIIFLIVLPILSIFFRGPLSKIIEHRKDHEKHSIGEFFIENFFELFEYVLSYLSNSMSFLRVGGFILSHAGMMAVVMSLSEMVGGAGSPIVVIIGNLFVMCLEGLIVGIQVLRLEFYEIFSRNFEGNGKPYTPARLNVTKEA